MGPTFRTYQPFSHSLNELNLKKEFTTLGQLRPLRNPKVFAWNRYQNSEVDNSKWHSWAKPAKRFNQVSQLWNSDCIRSSCYLLFLVLALLELKSRTFHIRPTLWTCHREIKHLTYLWLANLISAASRFIKNPKCRSVGAETMTRIRSNLTLWNKLKFQHIMIEQHLLYQNQPVNLASCIASKLAILSCLLSYLANG